MSTKTLPGILSIESIPSAELTLYPKRVLTPGSSISAIGNFTKLPTVGLLSCNISSERTSSGLIYTTKIAGTVSECDQLTTAQRHTLQEKLHAYRLTDVYRNQYLVGEDKAPYPEINFSPAIDGEASGSRVVPFETTWISSLPPIEIVVL